MQGWGIHPNLAMMEYGHNVNYNNQIEQALSMVYEYPSHTSNVEDFIANLRLARRHLYLTWDDMVEVISASLDNTHLLLFEQHRSSIVTLKALKRLLDHQLLLQLQDIRLDDFRDVYEYTARFLHLVDDLNMDCRIPEIVDFYVNGLGELGLSPLLAQASNFDDVANIAVMLDEAKHFSHEGPSYNGTNSPYGDVYYPSFHASSYMVHGDNDYQPVWNQEYQRFDYTSDYSDCPDMPYQPITIDTIAWEIKELEKQLESYTYIEQHNQLTVSHHTLPDELKDEPHVQDILTTYSGINQDAKLDIIHLLPFSSIIHARPCKDETHSDSMITRSPKPEIIHDILQSSSNSLEPHKISSSGSKPSSIPFSHEHAQIMEVASELLQKIKLIMLDIINITWLPLLLFGQTYNHLDPTCFLGGGGRPYKGPCLFNDKTIETAPFQPWDPGDSTSHPCIAILDSSSCYRYVEPFSPNDKTFETSPFQPWDPGDSISHQCIAILDSSCYRYKGSLRGGSSTSHMLTGYIHRFKIRKRRIPLPKLLRLTLRPSWFRRFWRFRRSYADVSRCATQGDQLIVKLDVQSNRPKEPP